MIARKKTPNALVLDLARQAQSLSAKERHTLITLLRAQDAQHPNFSELEAAFLATSRVRLSNLLRQSSNEIDAACDALLDTLIAIADKRQRHAITCAVISSATTQLLSCNRPVTPLNLLRMVATSNWEELLDLSYPGYGLKLVGETLCNPTLTSRASSPRTI